MFLSLIYIKLPSPLLLRKIIKDSMEYGYISSNCLDTVIIPTLRNINGNINDANNFHPIAIATILSKLFEHIILDICSKVFKICDNQFSFKAKVSSDTCVFTLKQLISLYHKQGSPVYCAFLDASKAFDRANHYMLFKKLIERNMPTCFVRILYNWYSKQNMKVKRGNCLSSPFSVSNGVRQGGVLSPYLFALYIDDLSVGMGLPRAAWVKLNRLQTGVGRFHSSMHKWGLVPSPNCECGASEQTADHVLTACPIHRAPHGARGLTVLDDETRCWLNNITASI